MPGASPMGLCPYGDAALWGQCQRPLVNTPLPGSSSPKGISIPLSLNRCRLPSHRLQMTNQNISFHSESYLGNKTSRESKFCKPAQLLHPLALPGSNVPLQGAGVSLVSGRVLGRYNQEPLPAHSWPPQEGCGESRRHLPYLHIGLLCVHELLDDFAEAICIREVASQWPRRRVLTLPRSFHAVGLGVVKIPTQRGDLLGTLGGNKRHRTLPIIISRPAPSWESHGTFIGGIQLRSSQTLLATIQGSGDEDTNLHLFSTYP